MLSFRKYGPKTSLRVWIWMSEVMLPANWKPKHDPMHLFGALCNIWHDIQSYMVLDRLNPKKTRKVDAFWLVWPNRKWSGKLFASITRSHISYDLRDTFQKHVFVSLFLWGGPTIVLVFPTLNQLASNGIVWNSDVCFDERSTCLFCLCWQKTEYKKRVARSWKKSSYNWKMNMKRCITSRPWPLTKTSEIMGFWGCKEASEVGKKTIWS